MRTNRNQSCIMLPPKTSRLFAWRQEDGQALVETALSVMLLLSLFLGAAEFGSSIYAAIEVSDAARAGVNYGVQSRADAVDTTGISAIAAADAPSLSGLQTTSSVSCICSDGTASSCNYTSDCSSSHVETILTVNTQATFTPSFRVPGLNMSFTLKGKAVQKVFE